MGVQAYVVCMYAHVHECVYHGDASSCQESDWNVKASVMPHMCNVNSNMSHKGTSLIWNKSMHMYVFYILKLFAMQ